MTQSQIDRRMHWVKQYVSRPQRGRGGETKSAKFKLQKSDRNNFRITSISYAHFQTMKKTPVKFKKDSGKIVGGVAFTRYLVSIYALVEVEPKNDYVQTVKK